MLTRAVEIQCAQIVDSSLESTRKYWRGTILGLPEEIANDPRPIADVMGNKIKHLSEFNGRPSS